VWEQAFKVFAYEVLHWFVTVHFLT